MIMSSPLAWSTETMILETQSTLLLLPEKKALVFLVMVQVDQPFPLMPLELQETKGEQGGMVILEEQEHLVHLDCLALQGLRVCQDLQDHFLTSSHISIKSRCPKEKIKDQTHSHTCKQK
jgi:hypothetical protein